MPTFKTGNMWDVFDEVDHFVITTNSTIKPDGSLVMGAGIARGVRDRWPGIDRQLGQIVSSLCPSGGVYGLVCTSKICLLQVKRHYYYRAELDLIRAGIRDLAKMAQQFPHRTFALNYPGIGKGGLTKEMVAPLLKSLPDNVQVWSFARESNQPTPSADHQRSPRIGQSF